MSGALFRLAVRQVMLPAWTGTSQQEGIQASKRPMRKTTADYNGEQSRARVLAAIEANPGISVPEIVRDFGITIGKARGAAYRLEDAGLIVRKNRGNGQFGYVRSASKTKVGSCG